MNEATQIASMGITTMLELMQARDEIKRLQKIIAEAEKQDEAAPVAKNEGGRITWMIDDWPQNCLLYTHLPQRTWVALTDEERNHARQTVTYSQLAMTAAEWAEAVQIETERRLKEKNK